MTNDDQKPKDEIPPITNTGAGTVTPWFETGTNAPIAATDDAKENTETLQAAVEAVAAEPEQGKAPNWWDATGTDEQSALPAAQAEWIERFLNRDKDVRVALGKLMDHLSDTRTGHLLPIPQRFIDAFNSEGPFATDDPTLRRYAVAFGVTGRLYTKLSTANDLIQQATIEVLEHANALTREAKRARGDTLPQPPQENPLEMMQELARKIGGKIMTLSSDGSMRPLDDNGADLKLVQEYLGAAAAPQEKVS